MMSAAVDSNKAVTASSSSRCASCGIAEDDDVTLKNCTACYLVKYCGIECQKAHRKQHKRACKKRAAELRDEILFKQPESSYLGDCPICTLPLSSDLTKSSTMGCCSKVICTGCSYANNIREQKAGLQHTCPFCRKSLPKTREEGDKLEMKRMEANDSFAICQRVGKEQEQGNYLSAFEYYTKAAELGDGWAHYRLAQLYSLGMGVDKDEEKEIHHLEEAAIGGHPDARHRLGVHEINNNGNTERAVKHWIISATQGYDPSMKHLLRAFQDGFVEKEVLSETLRAHKAAVDATKSPQRELANVYYRSGKW